MKKKHPPAIPTRTRQFTLSAEHQTLLLELINDSIDECDREEDDLTPESLEFLNSLQVLKDCFLPGVWIELYRAVEDDDGDFDDTREHEFTDREIRSYIRQELLEARDAGYLPKRTDVARLARKFWWEEGPKFLEFDSGRSHASGYWELRILGPDSALQALENFHEQP